MIYCDNHLLVVEKSAKVVTQPDLHERAKEWVKETFSKPGKVFLEPIHRLDKPVGGIVLFARTSKALSRLNEAMRQKQIRKVYHALVEGSLPQKGILEHQLVHGDFRAYVDPKGKKAVLQYRVLEQTRNECLVEIELHTGRYHQIRAQFSAMGHPIVGDAKYGSREKSEVLALHHTQLSLFHPVTKEWLTFQSQASFSFE